MSYLGFEGFEAGFSSLGAHDSFQNRQGTCSIVASTDRPGAFCLKTEATTSNTAYVDIGVVGANGRSTTASVALGGYGFYFKVETAPSSGSERIFELRDTAGAPKLILRLDSSRQVLVHSSSDALLYTHTTPLDLNRWYFIEMLVGTSLSTAQRLVRLDGTVIYNTNGAATSANAALLRLGKTTNSSNNTCVFYYDDCYLAEELTGSIKVLAVRPTAQGSTVNWTSGTGITFAEVDEIQSDEAASYIQTTSAQTHLFTSDMSGVDAGDSILALKTLAMLRRTGGVVSTARVRYEIDSYTLETSGFDNSNSSFYAVEQFSNYYINSTTTGQWTQGLLKRLNFGVREGSGATSQCTQILTQVLIQVKSHIKGLQAKTGSFNSTTTANGTSFKGIQSVSGVGFTPKLLLLHGLGSDGNSDDANFSFGFGRGTDEDASISYFSDDNLTTSDCNSNLTLNRIIKHAKAADAVLFEANLLNIESDGFSLEWVTADGTPRQIFYTALGGTDLIAKYGRFQDSASGNQTVSGLGFEPKALIILSSDDTGSNATTMIGVSDGTSQFVLNTLGVDASAFSVTKSIQLTDKIISRRGNGTTQHEASLVNFTSDGFVLNHTADDTTRRTYLYLAIGGVRAKAGTFTQSSRVELGNIGFQPEMMLFFTVGNTSSTSQANGARLMLGSMTVDTSRNIYENSICFSDNHNVDVTEVNQRVSSTKSINVISCTASTVTTLAEAEVTELNRYGANIEFSVNDAVAREFCYLALGDLRQPGAGAVNFTTTAFSRSK
jgi:hypothetical protein